MIKGCSQSVMRSKWFMPLFCLGLGGVVLAASWLGGHPGTGVISGVSTVPAQVLANRVA